MFKQFVALILLTVAAVLLRHQLQYVLNAMVSFQGVISHYLSRVFSGDYWGRIVQSVLLLLLIPLLIASAAASVYWAIRRTKMRNATYIVWVIWLILITTFSLKGV